VKGTKVRELASLWHGRDRRVSLRFVPYYQRSVARGASGRRGGKEGVKKGHPGG